MVITVEIPEGGRRCCESKLFQIDFIFENTLTSRTEQPICPRCVSHFNRVSAPHPKLKSARIRQRSDITFVKQISCFMHFYDGFTFFRLVSSRERFESRSIVDRTTRQPLTRSVGRSVAVGHRGQSLLRTTTTTTATTTLSTR